MLAAEEIEGASTVIPRSMVISVMLNGVLGLSILIATLFCMGDVQAALNSPTGYPFMEIFFYATGSNGVVSTMVRYDHPCIDMIIHFCNNWGL